MLRQPVKTYGPVIVLISLFSSGALAQTLPLRHGMYVVTSEKCDDTPNAAILDWDGRGFSGAHSSACTSHTRRRPDGRYDVSTKCKALGDGTPDPAGDQFVDVMIVNALSPTKFILTKPGRGDWSYRWCSARNLYR